MSNIFDQAQELPGFNPTMNYDEMYRLVHGRLPDDTTLGQVAAEPEEAETVEEKPKNKNKKRNAREDRWHRFNTFTDQTAKLCTSTEDRIWTKLFRHERDRKARVSIHQLANATGLSDRQVRRAIGGLKNKGLLTVLQPGYAGGFPTTYALHTTPTE